MALTSSRTLRIWCNTSTVLLFFFFFFLSISPSATSPPHDAFLSCFIHHVPSAINTTTQIIYTPHTPSYSTLLLSSLNNNRFLNSTPPPLLIVAPTHHSHVQASVLCGKKHGLRIRVRSGGHDFEGLSYHSDVAEAFVVVDLSRLRSIEIDVKNMEAWVESGATLGELYYNIAKASPTAGFPAGLFPTIGVGGHFSGGGVGPMLRKHGLASDNVVDARMVDVHGQVLDHESMGEDLFWAVRGGGGASFGVILSYKIRLVHVTPKVTVFSVNRNLSQGAIDLVTKWQNVAYKLPEDLHLEAVVQTVDDPSIKVNRSVEVSFQSIFFGGKEELLSLVNSSFPELGLVAEDCTEMRWVESIPFLTYTNQTLEALLDRRPRLNVSFKGKYDFVEKPISKRGWEKIWERLRQGTGNKRMELDPYGGKMYKIPESATPFPHRKGIVYKILYVVSWNEEGEEDLVGWTRRFYEFMAPYVSKNPRGAYINTKDLDIGKNGMVGKASYREARIWGRKYFKDNFERLALVKGRVDPDNYFWNEQSIPPLVIHRKAT